MTSRHAYDDTRWEVGSIVGSAEPQGHAASWPSPTAKATSIPESSGLPPLLESALGTLVEPTGPAVSFTVHPEPESVSEARRFAVTQLGDWGAASLIDDVSLVVSELVTNALRHSGEPTPWSACRAGAHGTHGDGEYGEPPLCCAPATIRLRLVHEAPWLLCGVMDSSTAAPRRKEPDYIAETGRGLHLVESFSIRWGWRGLPRGKVVWALFRAP